MMMFQPSRAQPAFTPRLDSATLKNAFLDKPNEDAMIADTENRIFIVADGVSRLRELDNSYPNPSPSAAAARLLVDVSHEFLKERLKTGTLSLSDLANGLYRANEAIGKYNLDHPPSARLGFIDLAGAVGLIAHLNDSKLSYAYLGDVELRLARGGKVDQITSNQTAAVEAFRRENKVIPNIEEFTRISIRNRPSHRLGWGVLTGEADALSFIRAGEVQLQRGDRIIISSDGLMPVLNADGHLAQYGGVAEIISKMVAMEDQGIARSDDKTIVTLDFQ